MTSTTRKNRNLMAEPMAEKGVRVLPGIGDVLGGRLEESSCDRAYMVQGQYLVMGKDEESFKDWLKDTCGANAKQQRDCYNCVRDWSDSFQ